MHKGRNPPIPAVSPLRAVEKTGKLVQVQSLNAVPVMVTMKLWLGQLAAGFALTACGFVGYVYSQTPEGREAMADVRAAHPKVAEAVDNAVIAGQGALDRMIQTALMDPAEANDQRREERKGELNFQVLSASRGPVAPAAPFPAEAVSQPTQAAAKALTQADAPHGPAVQTAAVESSAKPSMTLADGAPESQKPHPVAERIKSRVSDDMRQFFDLYLYVSKAEKGSWAQRMHVLARQPDGTLAPVYTWMVSTGKEEMMRNPHGVVMNTDTPEGFFRLDRGRFFADYTSYQWKAPMPHAMFFDWQIEGRRSGLAIHGTGPDEDEMLGQRASKGCIRLSPENAAQLFKLITENYAGRVPQFKIDPATGTQSTNGLMRRDAMGRIMTKRGYRVLVVIENYGGPSNDTIATIM